MDKKVSMTKRFSLLLLSYTLFLIIYNSSAWYALHFEKSDSFVFSFEKYIPFISLMIIPYMTSGLFFTLVFFFCSSEKDLMLLTKRLNFTTIVSGLFFFLFPLKYSFFKPDSDFGILNHFYQFLVTWDSNYNQAPSLHIGYACIFWSVINKEFKSGWKTIVKVWILLLGISTLTVYQHHFIDIITALLLSCVTFFVFPENKERNYRIGIVYFFTSLLFLLGAALSVESEIIYGILSLWISIVLFLIGNAYSNSNSQFLKKKDGSINILNKIVFFPYLITYKIIWLYFRKKSEHFASEILPQVYLGARLKSNQATNFIDAKTYVIDLCAETEENKYVRENANYFSFPFLDIGSIKREEQQIVLNILSSLYETIKPDEKIFIHCLMGYSRSVFFTTLFVKNQLNIEIDEAITIVTQKHSQSIFPKYLLD
ncbi:dual specificity protein phosphatase family protein [Flavobacterium procerum]|uniref:Dual specificity protein phosphatase family protein n=1 Tax=Flavobacterium procerum TaxID=1455569 RepID=A0ABV6BKI1_9FLAO